MIGQAAQRRAINLPTNGEGIVEVTTGEFLSEIGRFLPAPWFQEIGDAFRAVLNRHFRSALSYPKCVMRVWGSVVFYENGPQVGHVRLKVEMEARWVSAPGLATDTLSLRLPGDFTDLSEAELIELGIESRVESFNIEIGIGQGGAVTNLREVMEGAHVRQNQLAEGSMESAGRRDVNARRGVGIEARGGSGAFIADPRSVAVRDGRELTADLEATTEAPKTEPVPTHSDPFQNFVSNVQSDTTFEKPPIKVEGSNTHEANDVSELFPQPTEPEAKS